MRTAIIGIGAIGTVVGALATKNGIDVELVDSYKANVDALNEKGATITGNLNITVPVKAITPDQMSGIYDVVILITKQTANAQLLPHVLQYINENSIVCTLQNGIPEASIAEIVGKSRVAGATVGFGATFLEPGLSKLTSSHKIFETAAFEVGTYDDSAKSNLQKVVKVLEAVGGTHVLNDLMSVRWTKLLINSTYSGLTAALGCMYHNMLNDKKALTCAIHIASETVKVCHALNYRMNPFQGVDLELLEIKDGEKPSDKLPLHQQILGPHNIKASMLQDLEKGFKTEVDFIDGEVSKYGKKTGVPTPFTDKVIELINEAEANGKPNKFDIISRFDELLSKI